jgi:hypothetical protein
MSVTYTTEQLLAMDKGELVELLSMLLQAQQLSTKNMQQLTELLSQADARIKALEDLNKTQEAELIVLRCRP